MMFRKLLSVAVLTAVFSFALGTTDAQARHCRRVYSGGYSQSAHYGHSNQGYGDGGYNGSYGHGGYGYGGYHGAYGNRGYSNIGIGFGNRGYGYGNRGYGGYGGHYGY